MKLNALVLVVSVALANPVSAEVKIALDTKPNLKISGSYNWAYAFKTALEKAGMKVREMPRGSVGKETEKFDQLSTGLLEVSLSDVRSVAKVEPFIYGVRLPYVFDNLAHMDRALAAGKVFDRVNTTLAKHDIRLVALVPLGPASGIITTKAKIRKPADMAKLRMRALDDAQIAMYKAWGSSGTIVPWGEVPAGLQTGVIDGYLNSPFVPIMFGQTDFVKNFSDARVILPLRAVLISKAWYDGLTAAERAKVDAAAKAADAAVRKWQARVSVSALKALEKAGVTVQHLSATERAAFRKLSRAVYNSGLMSKKDVATWVSLSEKTR